MTSDLGKRVRAARGYTGISQATLADGLCMSAAALERFEAGLDEPAEDQRHSMIRDLAIVTRLPEQFFTVDYAQLEREESPESKLAQYEALIERLLGELARLLKPRQGDNDGKDGE